MTRSSSVLLAALGFASSTVLGLACGEVRQEAVASASSSASSSSGHGGSATSGGTASTGGVGAAVDAGSDADNGTPSDVYPAKHAAAPRVVDYGGPTVAAPKIQPIFFQNDDPSSVKALKDFTSKIGATQYWKATTAEYGVGPATALASVDVLEDAPKQTSDPEIQAWLAAKLNADDPAFATPDANTIYAMVYPLSTTISLGPNQNSCSAFGGYHSSLQLDANHGTKNVAYVVLPQCPTFGQLVGIDGVTGALSHELVEAVTDPYPQSFPAYALMDNQHLYWLRPLGGGEVGDMCAQFQNVFTKFAELPDYTVQRSWSNAAAKASHDPCVPALPGEVYFNAAPNLPDNVSILVQGQPVTVKGVKIAIGGTRTIDVDLFSDASTDGPFNVQVEDIAAAFGGAPHLDLSLDRDSGQNGEKLHLTITVLDAGKSKSETFVLRSELNGQENLWFGVVGQ